MGKYSWWKQKEQKTAKMRIGHSRLTHMSRGRLRTATIVEFLLKHILIECQATQLKPPSNLQNPLGADCPVIPLNEYLVKNPVFWRTLNSNHTTTQYKQVV